MQRRDFLINVKNNPLVVNPFKHEFDGIMNFPIGTKGITTENGILLTTENGMILITE